MKTFKKCIFLLAMYLPAVLARGQTPANDPNWNTGTFQFNDDFTLSGSNLSQWGVASDWRANTTNVILVVGSISGSTHTYSIGDIVGQGTWANGMVSGIVTGSPNNVLLLSSTNGTFITGTTVIDQTTGANHNNSSTPTSIYSDAVIVESVGTITGGSYTIGETVTQYGSGATGILYNFTLGTPNLLQVLPTSGVFNDNTSDYIYDASGVKSSPAASMTSSVSDNVVFATGAITGSFTVGQTVSQTSTSGSGTLCGVIPVNSGSINVFIIHMSSDNANFTNSTNNITQGSGNHATPSAFASATYCADATGNVSITNVGGLIGQVLRIQATNTTTWGSSLISTGALETNSSLTYGYYETSMELPCYGMDYDDAFWIWGNCFENALNCEILSYGSTVTPTSTSPISNYSSDSFVGTCPNTPLGPASSDYVEFYPSPRLDNLFHTYSFEWMPDHIILYFDGQPFRVIHSSDQPNIIPNSTMQIMLDIGFNAVSPARDQFPGNMYVKYVNVYAMNKSNCSTLPYTTTPLSATAFNQVYEYINIGSNSGNTTALSSSTNVCMRASGSTTIYGPFVVPKPSSGSFSIIPTACY